MASRNKWRTQYQKIENASKFHERVRAILATDEFMGQLRCFQEVPVQDLVPEYPNRTHRFDWYIEELEAVIELHGSQHYKFSNRGNIGYDEAQRAFTKLKARDRAKKAAAIEAGYEYIEIPYKEYRRLSAERLKKLIL